MVILRWLRERWLWLLSPVAVVLLWQACAVTSISGRTIVDTRFFPAPTTVGGAAVVMTQSGELWNDLGATVRRLLVGFVLGAVPGAVIGVCMGLSTAVRAVLGPLVDATFPIPKIAVLPLFILIFGIGEASKYAIIATAVVYLLIINTVSGVRSIERIHFDVAKNMGANWRVRFFDVALPGALPAVFTGLKVGLGVALLVVVAAEFVGAD